jgi:hypothetical protein
LRREFKDKAMLCYSSSPFVFFGNHGAIRVVAACNTNSGSHTTGLASLESSYDNKTGLDGATLMTGENSFVVKELEVFELVDPVE